MPAKPFLCLSRRFCWDEAWCYTATNGEMTNITNPVATSAEIYSRDMFDYWAPIDTLFI